MTRRPDSPYIWPDDKPAHPLPTPTLDEASELRKAGRYLVAFIVTGLVCHLGADLWPKHTDVLVVACILATAIIILTECFHRETRG